MSAYLELAGVGKTFGNVIALRDVSVDVPLGAVTCVLGDNGAGKSTLIKILSGVYQPDEAPIGSTAPRFGCPLPGRPWIAGSQPSSRISPRSP